jgi:hypothetical protein
MVPAANLSDCAGFEAVEWTHNKAGTLKGKALTQVEGRKKAASKSEQPPSTAKYSRGRYRPVFIDQ